MSNNGTTNPEGCACWSNAAPPHAGLLTWLRNCTPCDSTVIGALDDAGLARLRRDALEQPVIFVGTGTCGLGAGAAKTLAAIRSYLVNQMQSPAAVDVVEVGCIGLCSEEPLVEVQLPGRARLTFGHVTEDKVETLLSRVLSGGLPEFSPLGQHRWPVGRPWPGVPWLDEHPFFEHQTRCVLENCGLLDPTRVGEYIARGGYGALADVLCNWTPADVCGSIDLSGLRGRGGGGFPTGKKWKVALEGSGGQKYLICNADEGDPGAFMDRAVIEGDPHRLLEGMAIAAYAIGASKAYVYIRAEYPLAIARLRTAIAQAKALGLLGRNILDSGFDLEIVIKQGAGAFVCGEETALIHSIEGKRGMPRPRPPFPAIQGLFNKPTVINNVETLANVPVIMRRGGAWFAAMGTPTSKGTKVFALSGKVRRTGLVEVEMGTSLRQVVMDIGGGIPNGKKYKAVQIGGPSGGCVPMQHLGIQIDYETLKTVGAMMGSGGLVVMDEDTCMVDVAKYFMEFIQRESCGKCAPCREGTLRLLEILRRITRGRKSEKGTDALERFRGVLYLERLARVVRDTSLCGLGQSAPNPVLSTLRFFRDEYEAHIYERRCPAGVCNELRTFVIDPDACTGCGLCKTKCPTGAIVGILNRIHYVVEDKCIGCGACEDVCTHAAVSVAELEHRPWDEEESELLTGLFAGRVFKGWHNGKDLLHL